MMHAATPEQKKHPQWQAVTRLDRFLIEQHEEHLIPMFKRLARQCKQAWRQHGDVPAIIRAYEKGMVAVNEKQRELVYLGLRVAGIIGERAFAHELSQKYSAEIIHTFDLTAASPQEIAEDLVSLPTSIADVKLGGGLTEDQVLAYINAKDQWGYTYSEHIWKNDAKTKNELLKAIQDHLTSGNSVLQDAQLLTQYQVDDPTLPKYLKDLQTKAIATFSNAPEAKDEFLKALKNAKNIAAKLKTGPLGTGGFTTKLIGQLEKAVKLGNSELIEGAITKYIEKKGTYQAAVLLRTEGIKASQYTTWQKYKGQKFVLAIQWNLSGSHKHIDECDFKAEADIGLGPGTYYKEYIPWPDHPNGICYLTSVLPPPEELGTATAFEPSDESAYISLIDQLKSGSVTKEINKLGSLKEPPIDKIQGLIDSFGPKIAPIAKE